MVLLFLGKETKEKLDIMGENTLAIEKQMFLNIFSSGDFFVVHKKLLFYYGPDIAIFLTNLVDKYKYHQTNGTLKDGVWFYATHESQFAETGLTDLKIRNCKRKLKEDGIITTKKYGVPSKEYYSFNWGNAVKLMISTDEHYLTRRTRRVRSRPTESVGLDIVNPEVYYINNKIKLKQNKIIEEDKFISNEINISSSSCKKQKNKKITPNEFLKFWEIYPKKTDKGKCKTLWNRICQRKAEDDPDFITIEKAVKAQIETERWKEGFIPLPYTWLNQSRWLDDPAEMKSSYTKPKDPKRKSGHYEGKGAVKHKINKLEL